MEEQKTLFGTKETEESEADLETHEKEYCETHKFIEASDEKFKQKSIQEQKDKLEQETLFGVPVEVEKIEDKKSTRVKKKKELPLIEVPYVEPSHLLKWKLFLEQLCKEHNETALIYFNVSLPYDDCVIIHLDSHKYCSFRAGCVAFRFRKGNLVAYDSGFDGGTSTLEKYTNTALENEEEEVRNIMEKVFSKKCEEDYTKEIEDKKEFEVGEDFWIIDDYTIEKRLKNITDRKKILELNETLKKFKEDEIIKEAEKQKLIDSTIDDDFIYREDLHDWIFKEDEFGRYRERIWDRVEKIGTAIWFQKMGYPISPDSIYKNRYTGHEVTLKEEIFSCTCLTEKEKPFEEILQHYGFLTWEHWLPIEKWNDKQLQSKYKPFNEEEVAIKICENVARHFENDWILNTLNEMKKKGEKEEKMFTWFKSECNTYGCGTDEYDFNCNPKGVNVSAPFKKILSWRFVYDKIKNLPFKNSEKKEETKITESLLGEINREKKIIVKVKYGLDNENKRDFFISDNRSEMGIETFIGGTHSSGWNGNKNEPEPSFEEKEKNALEWLIKDIVEDGIPRENIEVVREEMNEEDLKQHEKDIADRRKSELVYAERDIENYSKKLKDALKVKYGYDVKIQVLKNDVV
jgi:hypothetical protein